jgi:hypothetical protein
LELLYGYSPTATVRGVGDKVAQGINISKTVGLLDCYEAEGLSWSLTIAGMK